MAQLDSEVGARLDEQMARVILAVAEMPGLRTVRLVEPRPKRQAQPKIDW